MDHRTSLTVVEGMFYLWTFKIVCSFVHGILDEWHLLAKGGCGYDLIFNGFG
jgi:hypothetical protein